MSDQCPRITDPAQCVRCRSLAQELLSKAPLTVEERTAVKNLLHKLRDESPLDDASRDFLNELAVRYLE